jgi:hypothetical protein
MRAPPPGESSIRSPCVHIPGFCAKYASWKRAPSASPWNPSGRDGKGFRHTSSPTPGAAASSLHDCTSRPRLRHWLSPRSTGRLGLPRTKQPMMSVPPEIDWRGRGPTLSFTQSKRWSSRMDPVDRPRRALVPELAPAKEERPDGAVLADREAVKGCSVREGLAGLSLAQPHERRHLRALDGRRRRRVEHRCHLRRTRGHGQRSGRRAPSSPSSQPKWTSERSMMSSCATSARPPMS